MDLHSVPKDIIQAVAREALRVSWSVDLSQICHSRSEADHVRSHDANDPRIPFLRGRHGLRSRDSETCL